MVDMPCRILIRKFQPLKQGFEFIVHTRKLLLFKSENKNVIGEKSKF